MIEQIRYGKTRYISFIILNLASLVLANYLAVLSYQKLRADAYYSLVTHLDVVLIMVAVDLIITALFDTMDHVLRRRKRKEVLAGLKHVLLSFALLAIVLFALHESARYSRLVVLFAYLYYFILFVLLHILWKSILKSFRKKPNNETAILMTTDRFVEEGIKELKQRNIEVQGIYLLKNLKRDSIGEIPVVKSAEEAADMICWRLLDRVYIYGLDHQAVPKIFPKLCRQMGMQLQTVDFAYRLIDLKTIQNEDPKYGALSFLESKRDIPFPIRRVYWITETEADLHRGFHAHKLNCQLLFCPYGKIDILLDDGQEKSSVTLEGPGKGLILMPGMWREMVWQESGSVLCVLASEYYDPDEYIRDYDEFIKYSNKNGESNEEIS